MVQTQREFSQRQSRSRSERFRLSGALSLRGFRADFELAPLPSNEQAITLVQGFIDGLERNVLIEGLSGWGKTHLLENAAHSVSMLIAKKIEPMSAIAWTQSSFKPECPDPLILDDLADALSSLRFRHELRNRLERRKKAGKSTLMAFTTNSRPVNIPLGRDWKTAQMLAPSATEKELIVRQVASRLRLPLNSAICNLIAHRVHGNGRSFLGALQRLQLDAADWTAPESVCRACGVLMPYFLGEDGWDPRDQALDAVQGVVSVNNAKDSSALCAYCLLEVMGLSEEETSAFLKVPSAQAYKLRQSVATAQPNSTYEDLARACRRAMVESFTKD